MKLILIMILLTIFQPVTGDTNMITVHIKPDPVERVQKFANYEPLEVLNEGYGYRYAKLTAYAPLDNVSGICADENPTVTSRGHYPSRKYAAVDPERIAYDTKLEVDDYGVVIAGDTGGALRNYGGVQIDLFFDRYEDAMKWGVKYDFVKVVE